jgi:hypothetical protein
MLDNVAINWWGVLAAAVAVTVLGGLWFAVIVKKAYAVAVGRDVNAPAPASPLFMAGPIVCNLLIILASAVLISALDITTLGSAVVFGLIVGVGYLSAMTFQIAINPVFARPLFYGAINSPYFIIASLITSISLALIG